MPRPQMTGDRPVFGSAQAAFLSGPTRDRADPFRIEAMLRGERRLKHRHVVPERRIVEEAAVVHEERLAM